MIQRIREAERILVYEKFLEKENEVIPAIVQRVERRNVYVDMDMAEGILPPNEQMPNEQYRVNDRIRVYITDVKKTTKGPQIIVSRTIRGLVKRLFEREFGDYPWDYLKTLHVRQDTGLKWRYILPNREWIP